MTDALDYCEDYENNDDNDWNTSTFKQLNRVVKSYLIFVIFFTWAKFLENKIYTEKNA